VIPLLLWSGLGVLAALLAGLAGWWWFTEGLSMDFPAWDHDLHRALDGDTVQLTEDNDARYRALILPAGQAPARESARR
jgi:hypothetical protein